jgi:hypothetical protein
MCIIKKYRKKMNDKYDKWTKKIALLGTIVAIIGGGGILGWYNMCRPGEGEEIIYQGSVQDINTRESIMGVEITFLGLTNKIPTRQTDSKGCFSISLSEEYSNVQIRITHKDYETEEFNRQLTKKHMKEPDIFYLRKRCIDKSTSEIVDKCNKQAIQEIQEIQEIINDAREMSEEAKRTKNFEQTDDKYIEAYKNLSDSCQNKYKQRKDSIVELAVGITRVKKWEKLFKDMGY